MASIGSSALWNSSSFISKNVVSLVLVIGSAPPVRLLTNSMGHPVTFFKSLRKLRT
jgi:hypothetical protein